MIINFGSKETEVFWFTGRSKKIPSEIQKRALIKLTMVDIASDINDLKIPPSNRLEKLKGDLEGFWSIRINDQFRIIFQFESGNAYEVDVVDYH